MSGKLKLELTTDALNELAKATFDARAGSHTVKVEKVALSALIRDHQNLVAKFRGELEGYL